MAWVDRNKATPNSLCVFIGGLPADVDDDELAFFLRRFGRVDDLYISRTPDQGHSKGFAFATFAPGVNKEAIFGEHSFKNKSLEIKLNTHGMLCLAGLPSDTNQSTIRKAFDGLGFMTVEVIVGGPGVGVADGIAFVKLDCSVAHLRALQLGSITVNGKKISISAKAPRRPLEPVPIKQRKRQAHPIERPSPEEGHLLPTEILKPERSDPDSSPYSNFQLDEVKRYHLNTPETSGSLNSAGAISGSRLKKYSAAYQPNSLTNLSSPTLSVAGQNLPDTSAPGTRNILLASLETLTHLTQHSFVNPASSIASIQTGSEPKQREVWVKFYTFPGMD